MRNKRARYGLVLALSETHVRTYLWWSPPKTGCPYRKHKTAGWPGRSGR